MSPPSRPSPAGRSPWREDFFQPRPSTGALFLPGEQRTALVPVEFLAGLQTALAKDFGPSAHHILYCAGFDWSLREMVRLGQRLRREPHRKDSHDLWQMDAKFVLESWWTSLAAAGWGACTFSALPHGLLLAEVEGSAPALACRERAESAAGRAPEPACHVTAGLLAGALSFYERAERHAVEVQCAAAGHATCQFIVGGSPRIDSVESWQDQKIPADEIRRRLAAA